LKSPKKLLIRNIVILVVSLVLLVGGGASLYADSLLNRINFVSADSGESQAQTGALFETNTASSGAANAKSGLLGGLYHDDAVTNILLLGVENYQKNDVGRSDSMMLVSVDNRHKKLKTTSFMRDLYLAEPGLGKYKLTEAYSRGGGKVKGAREVVATIEANFGSDIDRFVIVDFDVFPKIIDRLGGVDIILSADEADLVNKYSYDSKKVHAGLNTMTGLQARYYARIRDIGNDYERTARQRKVFASAVNKLKTSNIAAINSILVDTLPLVTTNLTKNEILSLAANSLTYLNYPVSEHRVPADGEFRESKGEIRIDGELQDLLIPDLDKCKKSLAKFLYENDIPTGNYES
jgi:LCP family protein required for cell wall assembly